jgi:hypothetical protein
MKHHIALCALAASLSAPIAASAAQSNASNIASPPSAASQLTAELAMQDGHFTLLDRNGNVVGFLVSDTTRGLTLRQIGRTSSAVTTAAPHELLVDYSKVLTPEQMFDANRAAFEEFFHIDHTP